MIFPCPQKIECDCLGFPITNYSAEDPDNALPCYTAFYERPIPLGYGVSSDNCVSNSVSTAHATACGATLSQAQALAQDAARNLVINSWTDPNCQPPLPPGGDDPDDPDRPVTYCNTPQTGLALCPDGMAFTFTVPAGVYCALTQAEADSIAMSMAMLGAQDQRFCIVKSTVNCCRDEAMYEQFIVYGGIGPFTWTLIGSGVSGLTITNETSDGRYVKLSGTPTTEGNYAIQYSVSNGTVSAIKTIYVNVVSLAPTMLSDATVGVAYAQVISALGIPSGANVAFSLSSGTLPTGLTLSSDGIISGTPTGGMPATFTIDVEIT